MMTWEVNLDREEGRVYRPYHDGLGPMAGLDRFGFSRIKEARLLSLKRHTPIARTSEPENLTDEPMQRQLNKLGWNLSWQPLGCGWSIASYPVDYAHTLPLTPASFKSNSFIGEDLKNFLPEVIDSSGDELPFGENVTRVFLVYSPAGKTYPIHVRYGPAEKYSCSAYWVTAPKPVLLLLQTQMANHGW